MIQGWTLTRAIRNNGCREVPFDYSGPNYNSRGYTVFKDIAVRSYDELPERDFVGCHELVHAIRGHSARTEAQIDSALPKDLSHLKSANVKELMEVIDRLRDNEKAIDLLKNHHEIEAHSVALAVAHSLKLDNYDLRREEDYLLHFMAETMKSGGDPQAHLYSVRDELKHTVEAIVLGGFISPKVGLQAMRAA